MEFYRHYESNLNKILAVRASSGMHGMNPVNTHQWINAQINSPRRQAARDLIEHTTYITFDQVWSSVGNLVKRIYTQINPDTVVIGVADPGNSLYFMAVIAVYYIRQYNYPDPVIVDVRSDLTAYRDATWILFDDMAYTGLQLWHMIEDVGEINFHIGLVAASQRAYTFLSLKASVYVDLIVPNLRDVIGPDRYLKMCYYFNPFSEGLTQVSVYFDHKMADSSSTFMRALLYGPVPIELDYPDTPELTRLVYGLIDVVPGTSIQPHQRGALKIGIGLLNKLIVEDVIPPELHNLTTFIPLIEGCGPPPYRQFVSALPYAIFIGGNPESSALTLKVRQVLAELINPLHRCLISFYKTGPYKMA